jgi:hypothetical protein
MVHVSSLRTVMVFTFSPYLSGILFVNFARQLSHWFKLILNHALQKYIMEKFISDKTHVILARHGQTEWNRHKMLMGRTDEPLTEEGFSQAEALAQRLKDFGITTIVSSPILRAKQTAQAVGNRLGIAAIKVHHQEDTIPICV